MKTRYILSLAAGLGAFVALGSGPSWAGSLCDSISDNLVSAATSGNCGFEVGPVGANPPSGWTTGGDTDYTGVNGNEGGAPNTGNNWYAFGAEYDTSSLSVTLSTVDGLTYDLNFFLANLEGSGGGEDADTETFAVSWDGGADLLPADIGYTPFGYEDFNFIVTGTGDDTLTFTGRNDPSYFELDDVCVAASGCVPEPGSLSLLGGALLGLGALRRRKKKA